VESKFNLLDYDSTGSYTLTYSGELQPPIDLKVLNESSTSITIEWSAPEGADHFKIQQKKTGANDSTYEVVEQFAIAGTYVVSGLEPETDYTIQVFSGTFFSTYETTGATTTAKTLRT
jgi:hypothetical protein